MSLSVLMPARCERWLAHTVADVVNHSGADTEVIVVLDGEWPDESEPLAQHPRVQVVYLPVSIGQRAATNLAARLSTKDYVMKLDAHCSVADGFDAVLIEAAQTLGRECVQIPAQKNLHIYDWVCGACKHRKYSGPDISVCPKCKVEGQMTREIMWKPKRGSTTTSWILDKDLHFQYDKAGERKQEGDICDVMTSLGACFFMARDYFWQLEGLDEDHGSWGQFGQEIACKAWLSGGRHVVNKRTWFAHFFRVGGIGFPYPIKGSEQEYARQYARNLWRGNHWAAQTRPLRWLVDKFWPVAGWTDADRAALPGLDARGRTASVVRGAVPDAAGHAAVAGHGRGSTGIVYYSDGRPDPSILEPVRRRLEQAGLPIAAVTLTPLEWPAAQCLHLPLERGYLAMFTQILAGLEMLDTEYAFLAEHDVLYTPEHFAFIPPRDDCYYYNTAVWHLNTRDGQAITYTAKRTSQLCANRELLVRHYRERLRRVAEEGFSRKMGFEPGSHGRAERVDDIPSATWQTRIPNIDLRHDRNLTPSRWKPEQFRDRRNCKNFKASDTIPGWGKTSDILTEL